MFPNTHVQVHDTNPLVYLKMISLYDLCSICFSNFCCKGTGNGKLPHN